MRNENFLLFIQPKLPPAKTPVIDKLVHKLTAAIREAKRARRVGAVLKDRQGAFQWFSGFRFVRSVACCKCCNQIAGITTESSHDFEIIGGYYVSPLALHFLAYHREEVPADQIKILNGLKVSRVKPKTSDFVRRARIR